MSRLPWAATLLALTACTPAMRTPSWSIAPAVADSIRTERVRRGVQLHRLVRTTGPLRAYVLDVDLRECVSVRGVKGAPVAIGRQTTSALLLGARPQYEPVAAVNADFFLFAPPGIPVGAHIEGGRLISGPVARPVFAMLASGAPWIGELSATVTIRTARGVIRTAWNRPARDVPGVVDAAWGVALDSTITRPVWRLVPVSSGGVGARRYAAESLRGAESRTARGDTILVVELGRATGGTASNDLMTLQSGDTVDVTRTIEPQSVLHAVGGFPVLMRDSLITGAVDSVSSAGFRGVNPRTAIGIGANGRRLLIMVIDGRQAGFSVGASLRETATLLRDLGARDALNLDGGGSSALVVADAREARGVRVVNRPSDATGERPVANALALVQGCIGR